MITIEDIKGWAKSHKNKLDGAKHTVIETPSVVISIVGGSKGLYGDFEENFEVALIDTTSKDFVTRYIVPDSNDDVIPYMSDKDLVSLVNRLTQKGFQVR